MPHPAAIRRRAVLTAIAACTAASVGAARAADAAPAAVTLDEARRLAESGAAVLIDIREPEEHARGVAATARLLPMSELSQRRAEIPTDPSKPVLLICNTQNRSRRTLDALRQAGYGHVRYVEGGMSEWVRRGWPVVSPVATGASAPGR